MPIMNYRTTPISLCALASLVAAAPLTSRSQQAPNQIQWGPCPDDLPQSLECGTLQVPIDWNATDGEHIALAMARITTTNTTNRIGTILYNPGGPGGNAIEVCANHAAGIPIFSQQLTAHFDIICPDPRGVGSSAPIKCDPGAWNNDVSIFPQNENELQKLVDSNRARGENCLNATGELVKHVDAFSVAKDIEAIRAALNDGKLNWLGQSYGSLLGAAYAELYPENIRAMVLDGMTDHSHTGAISYFTESSTYENSLNSFFEWCASNSTACGFTSHNIPKAFDDLVALADRSSVPAPGCDATAETTLAGTCLSKVTGKDIRLKATSFLYFKNSLFDVFPGWDRLGQALNESISQNNATLFSAPVASTNTSAIFPTVAIACLDWARLDVSNLAQTMAEFSQSYILGSAFNPHIGSASQSYQAQASCAGWPVDIVNKPHLLSQAVAKAPPVLMVNAVHDPSTSYDWALSMHEQMPTSTLLTRDGFGHTSYFLHGEAAAAMDQYLVDLTLPAPGTVVSS